MSLLYLFEFLLYMFLCAADLYKAWRNHELRAYLNYTMDNIYIYTFHFCFQLVCLPYCRCTALRI